MGVSRTLLQSSPGWERPALATSSQSPKHTAIITPLFTDGETEACPSSLARMGWLGPSAQVPFPPQIAQMSLQSWQGHGGAESPTMLPPRLPRAEVPALWAHSALQTPSTFLLHQGPQNALGSLRRDDWGCPPPEAALLLVARSRPALPSRALGCLECSICCWVAGRGLAPPGPIGHQGTGSTRRVLHWPVSHGHQPLRSPSPAASLSFHL